MTPTTTGIVPQLCADVPDAPRDHTRVYFDDGTSFGYPKAEPRTAESDLRGELALVRADLGAAQARVTELEGRLLEMVALARRSSRQALDALDRVETQRAIAVAACSDHSAALAREREALHRVRQLEARAASGRTLERAFDRAAHEITGRDHRSLVAHLDREAAEDETQIVDVDDPSIETLLERWRDAGKALNEAERRDPDRVPYDLRETFDDAEKALRLAARK